MAWAFEDVGSEYKRGFLRPQLCWNSSQTKKTKLKPQTARFVPVSWSAADSLPLSEDGTPFSMIFFLLLQYVWRLKIFCYANIYLKDFDSWTALSDSYVLRNCAPLCQSRLNTLFLSIWVEIISSEICSSHPCCYPETDELAQGSVVPCRVALRMRSPKARTKFSCNVRAAFLTVSINVTFSKL